MEPLPLKKQELAKYSAAKKVVEYIFDGMIVGIGTGTTVNYLISIIGELASEDTLDLIFVPSSIESRLQLIKQGLPVSTLEEYPEIDLYIDGADAVFDNLDLIKGRGGALTMEKILAHASQEFIVIADSTKRNVNLQDIPVPIEFVPSAINTLYRPISILGGEFKPRYGQGKIGPVISDNGNIIGDVFFSKPYVLKEMEVKLNTIPGIIENGIFCDIAHKVIFGTPEGKVEQLTK